MQQFIQERFSHINLFSSDFLISADICQMRLPKVIYSAFKLYSLLVCALPHTEHCFSMQEYCRVIERALKSKQTFCKLTQHLKALICPIRFYESQLDRWWNFILGICIFWRGSQILCIWKQRHILSCKQPRPIPFLFARLTFSVPCHMALTSADTREMGRCDAIWLLLCWIGRTASRARRLYISRCQVRCDRSWVTSGRITKHNAQAGLLRNSILLSQCAALVTQTEAISHPHPLRCGRRGGSKINLINPHIKWMAQFHCLKFTVLNDGDLYALNLQKCATPFLEMWNRQDMCSSLVWIP